MFTKTAAFLFLGMLLLIIVAADLGRMPGFLERVSDFPNGDRLGHLLLFGTLAFLFNAAFTRKLRLGSFEVPVVIVALAAFATAEELSQRLFSNRNFDLVDLACNYLGLALGGWCGARWRVFEQRSRR